MHFSRSLLDRDVPEDDNSSSSFFTSQDSVVSQLLNYLSFLNRLTQRSKDGNKMKRILPLPGQGGIIPRMPFTILRRKAVSWQRCVGSPVLASSKVLFLWLSTLLKSFTIQRIIAISSETVSHLNKILDPNTLTTTINFLGFPVKQTLF